MNREKSRRNIWGDEESMCYAKKICVHHEKSLMMTDYLMPPSLSDHTMTRSYFQYPACGYKRLANTLQVAVGI